MCNGRATPGGVVSHNKIIAPFLEAQAKIHEAAPITFLSTPDWDPLTALTLSWQPASDVLRAYFTARISSSTNSPARMPRAQPSQDPTEMALRKIPPLGVNSRVGRGAYARSYLDPEYFCGRGNHVCSLAGPGQFFIGTLTGQIVESSLAQGTWSARFI